MPSISIALCTYNGEKHLLEQLDSLAQQSLLPLELVVCDDQSQDKTWVILEQFAQQAPFPVHLHQNPTRLGVSRNFGRAVSLCTGEFIAFADQDDVWLPHKLSTLAEQIIQQPDVDAFFSDAFVVDEQLQSLNYYLWDSVRFTQTQQQNWAQNALPFLLKQDIVTGATLIFNSRWLPLILPIPPDWLHDAWVATLIATVSKVAFVNQPLIYYRQHLQQQIGSPKRSFLDMIWFAQKTKTQKYDQRVLKSEQLLERLSQYQQEIREEQTLNWLKNRYDHFKQRATLPASIFFRLTPIWYEFRRGRYHQFSAGWSSAVKDLLWGYS